LPKDHNYHNKNTAFANYEQKRYFALMSTGYHSGDSSLHGMTIAFRVEVRRIIVIPTSGRNLIIFTPQIAGRYGKLFG
jgi:hypothetical protein